jgi:hypothetical protein
MLTKPFFITPFSIPPTALFVTLLARCVPTIEYCDTADFLQFYRHSAKYVGAGR